MSAGTLHVSKSNKWGLPAARRSSLPPPPPTLDGTRAARQGPIARPRQGQQTGRRGASGSLRPSAACSAQCRPPEAVRRRHEPPRKPVRPHSEGHVAAVPLGRPTGGTQRPGTRVAKSHRPRLSPGHGENTGGTPTRCRRHPQRAQRADRKTSREPQLCLPPADSSSAAPDPLGGC